MGIYPTERKAAVIARMLPPHNQSVNQIARQEGIQNSLPLAFIGGHCRVSTVYQGKLPPSDLTQQ
ncbi:hypothetical protein M2406_003009 [Serratia sp. BIGb0163]|nr:hypothetical protein [Serratia sp. BIGb0163]